LSRQWQKLSGQKVQLVTLREETEQKTQEIADLQASQKLIEQQRRAFLDQAAELAVKLQARQQADAKTPEAISTDVASAAGSQKPAKDKNPFGNFFAKLMEDPETKKMIRGQQRIMLDQMYGPLVKKLNLAPEEADQFKDLLADNMIKATEQAGSLFGGDSATNRTERLRVLRRSRRRSRNRFVDSWAKLATRSIRITSKPSASGRSSVSFSGNTPGRER
jgi:hypothetical protein